MSGDDRFPFDTDWTLYLRYTSCGGVATPLEVTAHLAGLLQLTLPEQQILSHAVWELNEGL